MRGFIAGLLCGGLLISASPAFAHSTDAQRQYASAVSVAKKKLAAVKKEAASALKAELKKTKGKNAKAKNKVKTANARYAKQIAAGERVYKLILQQAGDVYSKSEKAFHQEETPDGKKAVEQPLESSIQSEVKVQYSATGFSPKNITLKTGGTVLFVNDGDDAMWVGSDPHPMHDALPGFDALRSFGKAENYSFTFIRAGTWGYHNHVNPIHEGTVTVRD